MILRYNIIHGMSIEKHEIRCLNKTFIKNIGTAFDLTHCTSFGKRKL